ncbi:MAG: hypothetical protein ACJAS1_004290 [Oleiphilaceae bacterium]|jgi:hypothetical protein
MNLCQIKCLGYLLKVLLICLLLPGCVSSLLNEKEYAEYEIRKNIEFESTTDLDRFSAGFIAKYGLEPEERVEFLEEIAEDENFAKYGTVSLEAQFESILGHQLYDQMYSNTAGIAASNGLNPFSGHLVAYLAGMVVADLIFSESGKDIVGGAHLPVEVNGRNLESPQDATEFIVEKIKNRVTSAGELYGLKIYKSFEFTYPKEETPDIDERIFWLIPSEDEFTGDQPTEDHLILQILNMHMVKLKPEEISPLLVSSLGFVPAYAIPENYFRGLSIRFLEEVRFVHEDEALIRFNDNIVISTTLKRNLAKHIVGPEGYIYAGEFHQSFTGGKYLAFKGKNYGYKFRKSKYWMDRILHEE